MGSSVTPAAAVRAVTCLLLVVAAVQAQFICEAPVDFVMVIDSSGSIDAGEYEQLRWFTRNLTESFLVSEDAAHVGLVQYATQAQTSFALSGDAGFVDRSLASMERIVGGATNIHDAILLAQHHLAEDGRPNRAHIILLMTDGNFNRGGDPAVMARTARSEGTIIIGLGVGLDPMGSANLRSYTSPGNATFIQVSDFGRLRDAIQDILGSACQPCPLTCCGRGFCNPTGAPPCVCEAGYTGDDCCQIEQDWLVPLAAATTAVALLAAAIPVFLAAVRRRGVMPPAPMEDDFQLEEVPIAEMFGGAGPELDLDTSTGTVGTGAQDEPRPSYYPISRITPGMSSLRSKGNLVGPMSHSGSLSSFSSSSGAHSDAPLINAASMKRLQRSNSSVARMARLFEGLPEPAAEESAVGEQQTADVGEGVCVTPRTPLPPSDDPSSDDVSDEDVPDDGNASAVQAGEDDINVQFEGAPGSSSPPEGLLHDCQRVK